ncbi:MAG: OmpA family protein [Alphaproteobacteria bacterium]|nr:OmpA family protein [Alphaproteobacteria bacterium]
MKKIMFVPVLLALAACATKSNINDDKVFFAFDSAEITDAAKKDLHDQSRYMKKHTDKNVVLEGHCDERGSTEYNLALGALRAGNAAHVMIKDGIEPERIKTISYGKENPQYPGSGEKIWAKNRNVTTKTKTK